MIIEIANEITIKEPTKEFKDWCKKEWTISNPDYDKKMRLGLWLGNTPEHLKLYKVEGQNIILPYGCKDYMICDIVLDDETEIVSKSYNPDGWGDEPVGAEIPLYEYQKEAVDAINRNGILQAPAGSGKTQMGLALISKIMAKALWLTHTLDLLQQSYSRAKQYFPPDKLGIISNGSVNIGEWITFATVQTMSNIDLTAYKNHWATVIVDECHRASGSPASVTRFYKVLNNLNAPFKIGLSATVHRADGMIKATHALLGRIIYTVPDEAVEQNIMRVGIYPEETEVQLTYDSLNTDGTLNFARMTTELCNNEQRNKQIVKDLQFERDHSCLILSSRLEHLDRLIALLPDDMKNKAVKISGKLTSKVGKAYREKAIEQMRSGEKKYLFATYSLAKEGLDIPRLDRLFLTTPQKDYAVVTQSVGRVARVHSEKQDAWVYDYVDDFPYAVKAYKERCRHYRKNKCYWKEGD